MSNIPSINEKVLDGIPEWLIRPLLAISFLEIHADTIEDHQQLISKIEEFLVARHNNQGEDIPFYLDIRSRLYRRMLAMIHTQTWANNIDSEAIVSRAGVERWSVNIIYANGDNHEVLVTYEPTGLDVETMEEGFRPIVTEKYPRGY